MIQFLEILLKQEKKGKSHLGRENNVKRIIQLPGNRIFDLLF